MIICRETTTRRIYTAKGSMYESVPWQPWRESKDALGLSTRPFEMMAGPLTPDFNIKEEQTSPNPQPIEILPEILVKNEPLSPSPHHHVYEPDTPNMVHDLLLPKMEQKDASTNPGHCNSSSSSGSSYVDLQTTLNSQGSNSCKAQNMQQQFQHQPFFLDAVKKGNRGELERLLDLGQLNVNGFDVDGQTALHRVCKDGNLEVVKLLVRFGADVRLYNKEGWSALHLACWGGHQNIVRYLLNAFNTNST